ncbi:MAG: M20 aminoacylase family protein [Nitratireductor sp.]
MPIVNRLADFHDEITAWRRDFHENPEILYETVRTAEKVAELLKGFGVDEVVTGIGQTGVVGVIKGKNGGAGKTIGMRADMDALPINEITGKEYASKTPGKMHACGHDGHTAMLLGAAKYLTETRNFHGTVAVIFQPAEEGGGGGRVMVKEGLMERFGIERVFGMHNAPGLPVGQFATRPGAIMASTAEFTITIKGKGGHAAFPHQTVDPIVITSRIVGAMQSIASRSADPVDPLVVSVTKFHAGDAYNVIPETAEIAGTVRTLRRETADLAEERIRALVTGIAVASGAEANIHYDRNYPVTFNHAEETDFAVDVARDVAGEAKVDPQMPAMMGGEDFSYMLEARPGSFVFVGNGDTANLHHPAYDFNDEAIPHGISYWVRLTEKALAA